MESLSAPGKILLTENTKNYLGGQFKLQKVPGLNVKGKGKMDAWQLVEASTPNSVLPKNDVA